MIRRTAILAAAMLLAVSVPGQSAPKSRKGNAKPTPEPSAAKTVDSPAPSRVPDNAVLPIDNGARAEAEPRTQILAQAVSAPANPPAQSAPGKDAVRPDDNATAALGNDVEYNRRLLAQAIRMGLLKPGSKPAALTHEVMNRMIDSHVLKDAIRRGVLPANATPAQVTPAIRAVMKKGGYLVHYYPDGSVNPNYGTK